MRPCVDVGESESTRSMRFYERWTRAVLDDDRSQRNGVSMGEVGSRSRPAALTLSAVAKYLLRCGRQCRITPESYLSRVGGRLAVPAPAPVETVVVQFVGRHGLLIGKRFEEAGEGRLNPFGLQWFLQRTRYKNGGDPS